MKWVKIHLTLDQVKNGVHVGTQNEFAARWRAERAPKDAAMFDSAPLELAGKTLYFSPGSIRFLQDIIDGYAGAEIERPDVTEVALLVGHADVFHALFT